MRLRDIPIGIRHIRTKGRSTDANRKDVFDPSLARIASLKRITSYPLDRSYTAENRRQQIAHGQVFDLPVAVGGPDHRTLQKAMSRSALVVIIDLPFFRSALVVIIIVLVTLILVLVVFCHCLPSDCQTGE